ncbi:MAG: UDP-3-O-acyl-N-acetylglucosamine deacetylase [Planctomycetaceae bacterium]|jgi:UDP-3-O-acyl N-acetylglucosamine deacetylase|nr:UDP-3-O-acyl-N-acetylglucosamine deacetylase [Planctomycetaceae bacterium]
MSNYSTLAVPLLFSGKFRQSFRLQNTLARRVQLSGFGFWSGADVVVEFCPAGVGDGVYFVRTDLAGEPRIPALVQYREEKPRQTSLVNGQARVDMVEHVLAAVRGMGIDNCEIRTNRPEMPGFDGSSERFFVALNDAGLVTQPAVRNVRLVTRSFKVGDKEHWINVMPCRNGGSEYKFTLVPSEGYPQKQQDYSFRYAKETFQQEVMDARTFLNKCEADYLLSSGLCQRVTPRDVLVLTPEGPIDNKYRYENECARHKVLDMIGDFSLVDCDWVGMFESYRGGHSLNAECVRQLLDNSMLLDESFVPKNSDLMIIKRELQNHAA